MRKMTVLCILFFMAAIVAGENSVKVDISSTPPPPSILCTHCDTCADPCADPPPPPPQVSNQCPPPPELTISPSPPSHQSPPPPSSSGRIPALPLVTSCPRRLLQGVAEILPFTPLRPPAVGSSSNPPPAGGGASSNPPPAGGGASSNPPPAGGGASIYSPPPPSSPSGSGSNGHSPPPPTSRNSYYPYYPYYYLYTPSASAALVVYRGGFVALICLVVMLLL